METNFTKPNVRDLTRRDFIRSASASGLLATSIARLQAQPAAKLKAAVIGHTGRGDYGHGLDGIFANRQQIELVALADPDPDGRAKTAAKIGAPRQYADYREMLDKERPNLVSLAMRQADQHHAIASAILRSGAHLYSEKPFTTTPSEADDLLSEAAKRELKIAVAHTLRMSPQIVLLKRAMAEGMIGDLVEMRAFGKQDARAGGEDMMVLGSHLFDLMRLFAGDPIWGTARVRWQGRDIVRTDGHLVKDNVGLLAGDEVFAQFAFPKGVNATFTSTTKLRETTGNWGIEFYGSKGAARLNCDVAPNIFIRRATAWKAEGKTDAWEPLNPALLKSPSPQNLGPVGDWLEAVAHHREPECSGRNAMWAVEMVMAVYHSALSNGRIALPLANRQHPLAMK